jgi:hypothetical protein
VGPGRTPTQIALSRCGWLTLATAVLWLVLLGPAWVIAGRDGLIGLSCSAGLCLVPGLIVFALAAKSAASGANVSLVILGGTVLRMMFVLVGMLIVQSADPRLGFREFVVWLLTFYLSMLAIETFLVLMRPQAGAKQPGVGA